MAKEQGFFQCQNWVFRNNKLTPHERLVFCVLLSLCTGGREDPFISYDTIGEFSGLKRTSVYSAVKGLIKKNMIKHSENQNRNSKRYKVVNRYIVQNTNGNSSKYELPPVQNTNSTNKTITNTKEIYKEKDPSDKIPYKEIITDLNSVTGRSFKFTSSKTQGLISARWKEGYRLDDFKKVHRAYYVTYKGTKFEKYAQPSTLYNGKFDERLQLPVPIEQKRSYRE